MKIASIGECMIELRHRSAADLSLAFGGDTLNTAVYLARLLRLREASVDYVTALGDDADQARARAYEAIAKVEFDGVHYRHDIGATAKGS